MNSSGLGSTADQLSAFIGQLGQMGVQGQQVGHLVQLMLQSQAGGGQFGQMEQQGIHVCFKVNDLVTSPAVNPHANGHKRRIVNNDPTFLDGCDEVILAVLIMAQN